METQPSIAETEFIQALRGSVGVLPPGPHVMASEHIAEIHRRRIIAGMAEALAEHGYNGTTVADVVRAAHVSRRTFYQHFSDKRECMIAMYDVTANLLLEMVEQAFDTPGTWQERTEAGLRTFFLINFSVPRLARVSFVDMPAAGPEALEHVRAIHLRFANLIRRVATEEADALPPGWGLDELTATAVIGAVNELTILRLTSEAPPDDEALVQTALRIGIAALSPSPIADPD